MPDYTSVNKAAWEYNAYDFWIMDSGTPAMRARKIKSDPIAALKKYAEYFDSFENVKVANICGSCGKKAVPMALLGADVTIFDISSDNARYAKELASSAGANIEYVVCDVLSIDEGRFGGFFDVVFMEGGVLHYFHDINAFFAKMYAILRPGGKMICSDFHPFTKINDSLKLSQSTMSYFSTAVFESEMAHARFFEPSVREKMPKCSLRKYTISEIINALLRSGFCLRRFDEHPSWIDETLPGEFTAVAEKQ